MKSFIQFAAVVSFALFFFPGAWLILNSRENETAAVIFGMILAGIAFFVGPMLWLTGQRVLSKQDSK